MQIARGRPRSCIQVDASLADGVVGRGCVAVRVRSLQTGNSGEVWHLARRRYRVNTPAWLDRLDGLTRVVNAL